MEHDSPLNAQGNYPVLTPVTLELLLHTGALQILFKEEQPLMVPIRPTDKGKLHFFVGDASQEGFGGAPQFLDGMVMSQERLWDPNFAEMGSNLQEAQNQVNHLLQEIRIGKHNGCKLWAATDNSIWSDVWNKGSFLLVISFTWSSPSNRRLESMRYFFTVIKFWVTG